MKKFIIKFVTIILLISVSNNYTFSEKIVCKVREGYYGIVEVYLNLYDDKDLGYIWQNEFAPRDLTKVQLDFLNQINGLQIDEKDPRFKKIKKLTDKLEKWGYCPQPYLVINPRVSDVNIQIFKILESFLA